MSALFLPACSLNSTVPEAVEVQNAFSNLCFERATERIERHATPLQQLFISDIGNTRGDWDFDLFFSTGKPSEWGGQAVLPPDQKSNTVGSFEIAYKHTPITVSIAGKKHVFRSVDQTVTDLSTGLVVAERHNVLFGNDFNRAWQCLDADWFKGNYSFVERVIGRRFVRPEGVARQEFPPPTRYVKARLLQAQVGRVQLRAFRREEGLPIGSTYVYNDRKLKLRDGEMYLTHGSREPLEIARTIESDDRYFFVLLPDGHVRSWPLRQLLVEERLLSGALVRSAIVQIPPVLDWYNGWGLDPESILITTSAFAFRLHGAKVLNERYADQRNEGRYQKSYDFVATLWD